MNVDIKFRNDEQREFFWHRQRNGHFGGGFGNGKSFVACQRGFVHLATFKNYGLVIARQTYKRLRSSTMKTFFKICPEQLVFKHDENAGLTVLINKSFIYWMHLDTADEQDLRGLETNSVLIDQGEEVQESLANVLDARVGRWDKAQVPNYLLLEKVLDLAIKDEITRLIAEQSKKHEDRINEALFKYSSWPKDHFGERFTVPNYFDVLSNPSEEDELHWIYRQYNENSPERLPAHTVFNIERKTQDELNDAGTITRILSRDQEFIDKYYYGKTGSPRAIIHKLDPLSIIKPKDYDEETFRDFIIKLLGRGSLYRILDHGETGITACGWEATLKKCHIFFGEYYQQGKFISDHRKRIDEIGRVFKDIYVPNLDLEFTSDWADPQIFKKTQQNNSQFSCVADEYGDEEEIEAPPIYWQKADNNEFATRNRINELLKPSARFKHPITDETPAPGIYFVEYDADRFAYGIVQAILQIKAQKRTLLGSVNGKNIYSEERDDRIVDHAYDFVRYAIAMHNIDKTEETKAPPKRSFAYFNALLKNRPDFIPASGKGN